jgi:hypothetical protein
MQFFIGQTDRCACDERTHYILWISNASASSLGVSILPGQCANILEHCRLVAFHVPIHKKATLYIITVVKLYLFTMHPVSLLRLGDLVA